MKSILSAKSVVKVSMKYLHHPQNLQLSAHPVPLLNPLPRMPDGRRTYYRDISDELHDSLSVSSSAIRNFLTLQNIVYKPGYTCYSVRCKQCRPGCKNDKTEKANILINTTSGGFQCTTCSWSGKWQQFQKSVDAFNAANVDNAPAGDDMSKEASTIDPVQRDYKLSCLTAEDERQKTSSVLDLADDDFTILMQLYQMQGISRQTLETFGVRVYPNKEDLYFPRQHLDKTQACGFKRTIVRQMQDEVTITEQISPREGGILGLFGWNVVPNDASELVITSNEFDAMIVRQQTGRPVVALPKGISVLPVEALPLLEQFDKIILWLSGGGNRAWQAAKLFTRKLVEVRCFLISPELVQLRALPAYQKGKSLTTILDGARPVSHKAVIQFGSFRQEVLNELCSVEESTGLRWKRFPMLNRIVKGHRRGELTILTGPTGCGKTTFLSEYSLDLCIQGVRTLWGSFEIRNSRLAKTMLNQFSRKSMQRYVSEFDYWADRFEQLSMYFMAFHGQESMENVLDAMQHAVYVHDIEHIVVDNLQFMMGAGNFKGLYDRILRQDQIIEGFRRFASMYDCHITLVVHPRKELDNVELSIQSIYGGAKASQEADNIFILQNNKGKSGLLQGKRYIQVAKNRFDGELGLVPLYYDKDSQSYMKKEKGEKGPLSLNRDVEAIADWRASRAASTLVLPTVTSDPESFLSLSEGRIVAPEPPPHLAADDDILPDQTVSQAG